MMIPTSECVQATSDRSTKLTPETPSSFFLNQKTNGSWDDAAEAGRLTKLLTGGSSKLVEGYKIL